MTLSRPTLGRDAPVRRLRLVSLDVDPVFVLARLDEIPTGLSAQPELGIGPARFLETNGHLRGDSRVAVQNPREGVTSDTQNLGRFGHVQTEWVGESQGTLLN